MDLVDYQRSLRDALDQNDYPKVMIEEVDTSTASENSRSPDTFCVDYDESATHNTCFAPFLASSFVYPPLKDPKRQIRLINFEPIDLTSSDSSPIRCSLRGADLTDSPKKCYNVLSYCWGDALQFKPIYVNGQLHHIRANLEAALRNVRNSDSTSLIWADALCINQSDLIEKACQVDMMAYIFSNAALCIIWLGSISPRSSLDPNTIYEPHALKAFDLLESLARGEHYTRPGNKDEVSLGPLLKLQWWHRIWTVQEVVLPSHCIVICGSLKLPWKSFVEASRNFRIHHHNMCCNRAVGSLKEFHTKVEDIEDTRKQSFSANEFSMIRILQKFQDRGSWDPRDKVFGLMALCAKDSLHMTTDTGLAADYSLKSQEVFIKAARRLTEETRSLEILLRTREYGRDKELPSWVPDWTAIVDRHRTRELRRWSCWKLHRADGGRPLELGDQTKSQHPGTLLLMGVNFDEIIAVGSPCQDPRALSASPEGSIVMTFPDKSWWNLVDKVCGSIEDYPAKSMSYSEAFMRVLALDCVEDSHEGVVDRRIGPDDVAPCLREIQSSHQHKTYFKSKMMNRTFFITKNGLIGMGPVETAIGDSAFVLLGGNVPFILRNTLKAENPEAAAQGQSSYTFVGDAYVYGAMDGEYADEEKKEWVALI